MTILTYLKKLDRTTKTEIYYAGECARDKLRHRKLSTFEFVILNCSISKVIRYIKNNVNGNSVYIRRLKGVLLIVENNRKILLKFPTTKFKKNKPVNKIQLLKLDAKSRFFTINSIYVPINSNAPEKVIDIYNGKKSIKRRKIETIENVKTTITKKPELIMYALVLNAHLNYSLTMDLYHEIKIHPHLIDLVDVKIIRDGLKQILISKKPSRTLKLMFKLGILNKILPELVVCKGLKQNTMFHKYDVFDHCLLCCDAIKSDLILRFAALFHDIGKAPAARKVKVGGITKITFYNHERLSAKLAYKILRRLKFTMAMAEQVSSIVQNHMYNYNPAVWSDAAVDRLIQRLKIKQEDLTHLNEHPVFQLRRADRVATGKRLHAISNIQQQLQQRIIERFKVAQLLTRKNLDVDGHTLMEVFHLSEGPTVGHLLTYLFEKVKNNEVINQKKELIKEASNYLSNVLT